MRCVYVSALCLALFSFYPSANTAYGLDYLFEQLSLPGAEFTTPLDINNDGVVVGVTGNDFDGLPLLGGFVWRDGEFSMPDVGFSDAVFAAISDSGLVAGTGFDFFSFTTPVFVLELDSGDIETFEVPDGFISFPGGINGNGEVVGAYFGNEDEFLSFIRRNDDVGVISIPGLTEIGAADINELGQIVGGAINEAGVSVGFILQDETTTLIEHPEGETELLAINNLGQIVGSVFDGENSRAFIYDGSSFEDVSFPDADETVIWGINDHGVIVGEYFVDDTDAGVGFIATPVPEPGGWLLAIFAFAGACSQRRPRLVLAVQSGSQIELD